MIDHDVTLAARLLEQSLAMGVTPTALSVLARMREQNPILANYVVAQTLEKLRSRPSIVALTGLHLLTAYVFPQEPYLANSSEIRSSDDALRFLYFSTGYDVLMASLQETDTQLKKEKRYTDHDLRFRLIYQGQIVLILTALAPRYGPQLLEELNALARRFSGTVPHSVADLSRFIAGRLRGEPTADDNQETAIAIAIANGEFLEARRLIDKVENDETRKAHLKALSKAEFNAHLGEADLTEALNVARRIENANLRVLLLLQLAKAAYRKDDSTFAKMIVSEARSALTNGENDGLRARIILSLAAEIADISDSDAIDLLHNAVTVINSLPKPKKDKEAPEEQPTNVSFEIDDPRSLADSPDLQRAFSFLARKDFDGVLIAAGRINSLPVQLIARLATSEVGLTRQRVTKKVIAGKKGSPSDSTADHR